jgi:ATP-dependent 26S proteasome regulatory subunit
MMTAMNLQHLPPALVRSGRVELWLEMKLPDREARGQILKSHLQGVPSELSSCDLDAVLAATDGFTGADLKSLVGDAKGLYAYGRASGLEPRPSTEYFLESATGVRENKERYQQAEQAAQARPRARATSHFFPPPPFDESDD